MFSKNDVMFIILKVKLLHVATSFSLIGGETINWSLALNVLQFFTCTRVVQVNSEVTLYIYFQFVRAVELTLLNVYFIFSIKCWEYLILVE